MYFVVSSELSPIGMSVRAATAMPVNSIERARRRYVLYGLNAGSVASTEGLSD